MHMAPVSLDQVCTVLIKLGTEKRAGIWHLSAERDINYAESARLGAAELGLDERFIDPIATQTVAPSVRLPRYTTLDVERLPQALNVTIPDATTTVRAAFRGLIRPQGSEDLHFI
jgi:dTDP-4-dehydrorhamnose reductase